MVLGAKAAQRLYTARVAGSSPVGPIIMSDRWTIPADIIEAGKRQQIRYDGAPLWNEGEFCTDSLTQGAKALANYLESVYSVKVLGFSCRQNTANKKLTSIHGTGRALDIMIKPINGKANSAVGDVIANWLIINAENIGVQYIIWNRTYWSGLKSDRYKGPNPHIDHIHVEINNDGASMSTPWFKINRS